MTSQHPDLIAVVDQSPAAAGSHDRERWINLFTPNGQIEDPVGSRPHIGRKQIARFYDTFIGPRDITFHRNFDIVSGATVIRDLDLEVSVSPTRSLIISAVLRYDLDITAGIAQIDRLRAYWELPTMLVQFLRQGAASLPAGLSLATGLLRHQKISGTLGFARGLQTAGRRGKAVATTFVHHLAGGRPTDAGRLLGGPITANDGQVPSTDELAERLRGAVASRVIASGQTVVVATENAQGRAVLFAEITSRQNRISTAFISF